MARIAGVDLPRDKRTEIGLTYIYGIGLDVEPGDPEDDGHQPRRPGQGSGRGAGCRLREVIERNYGWKATCGARSA